MTNAHGYYLKIESPVTEPARGRKPVTLYVCPVCQNVYVYSRVARNCCLAGKPVSDVMIGSLEYLYAQNPPEPPELKACYRPTPRTRKPGDGTKHPDKWRHWRRGKPGTPEQTEAVYRQAAERIEQVFEYGEIVTLETLFPSTTPKKKRDRNALQRMAYAFHLGSWQNVRGVFLDAIREAYERGERDGRAAAGPGDGPSNDLPPVSIPTGRNFESLRESLKQRAKHAVDDGIPGNGR